MQEKPSCSNNGNMKSVSVNLRLIGKYSKDFVLLNFEVRTSLGFYEKYATLAAPLKYVGVSCKAKQLLEGCDLLLAGWTTRK